MLYRVEKTTDEIRIYSGTHHFLSIIHQGGIFDLRARPGQDPNGWGTSVYLQPFLPGALLRGSIIDTCTSTEEGLVLEAHGIVSLSENESAGTWSITLLANDDPSTQQVHINGTYQILLAHPLAESLKGDLNIVKIASNYLRSVPQQTRKIGDTGDVKTVEFTFDNERVPWKIADSSAATFFHPKYVSTELLRAELHGDYYDVDSHAQGFDATPIICAYKPSITVSLSPKDPYPLTIFAHCEDGLDAVESTKHGKDIHFSEGYWYDNVGITPLIIGAHCTLQAFQFGIELVASSIEPSAS